MSRGKSGLEPAVIVPFELTEELRAIFDSWPERFKSKALMTEGCWEWQKGKANGYGRYALGKKYPGGPSVVANAHRHAYQLVHGPIPDSHHVDHLCRNHGCIRPDHLEAVAPKVNAERGRQSNVAGFCRAGKHPWTEDNILTEGATRRCRPCRDERERAYRPPSGNAHADRTHCPAGHAYDKKNTRVKANGSRDCRACHRVQERIKYRAKRNLPIREEHYVA